jgi:hypothetical protein
MYNTFWKFYFLQFSVHAQTTVILCDNLINIQQVTHCLVAWNSCPLHRYNVCDQLFPCILNIVYAVHDVKFSLSSHPYMQWSVYTRYIILLHFSAVLECHHQGVLVLVKVYDDIQRSSKTCKKLCVYCVHTSVHERLVWCIDFLCISILKLLSKYMHVY